MKPSQIALLPVISNVGLTILKLSAGLLTESLSVLSEAMDSGIDLLASLVAWLSLKQAEKPPDRRHPYGHGKWEHISSGLEAGLIAFGGALIIYHGLKRLFTGTELYNPEYGIAAMAISIAVNLTLSMYISREARKYDSIALRADAWHLRVNVYQAGSVMIGLVLIEWTGLTVIDPLIAIGLALFILRIAYDIMRRSFSGLLDERLSEEEEEMIGRIINSHCQDFTGLISFHDLRTRRAGRERHIDLHLVVRRDERIEDIHRICDHLEEEIRRALPGSHIIIHVEPEGEDQSIS